MKISISEIQNYITSLFGLVTICILFLEAIVRTVTDAYGVVRNAIKSIKGEKQ